MNNRIKKKRKKRVDGSYKNYRILKKISRRISKIGKTIQYYDFSNSLFQRKYITIDLEIKDIEN